MQRSSGSMSHSKHRSGRFGKHQFRPPRRRLFERVREAEAAMAAATARRSVGVKWFDSITKALKAAARRGTP